MTKGDTRLDQDDIDRYFNKLRKEDDKRPDDKKESASTKGHRIAGVKIYLNDSLKLKIEFKDYSTKSGK